MTSIITNSSASTALKVLRQTETALGVTQERISTGFKVNNAKDDASTWAISQGIKSDVSSFKTISEGLTMASNALKTASGAATSIKDQITSIQNNIAKAQAPGADKAAIQSAIDASLTAISNASSAASFNGTNLVQGTDTLKVLSGISRDSSGTATAGFIDVARADLTLDGGLSMLKGLNVSDDALTSNANAGKAQLKVDLGGPSTAFGKLSFSYTSNSGTAKTVSLDYSDIATGENIADSFVKAYGAQLKADGIDVAQGVTAGAKDTTLTFTAVGTNAKVGQATGGAGLVATLEQSSQTVLDFNADANPAVGKEFALNVSIGGKDYGIKLRVVDSALGSNTGDALGVDADGNQVIALSNADTTTGALLAQAVSDALVSALDDPTSGSGVALFNTAGGTEGTDIGVAVNGTTVTLSSESVVGSAVKDTINGFQLPTADFSKLQASVDAAQKVAISAAQAFGTAQSQAESQKEFLSTLTDSLEAGVGALIDADITAESARLNALQTQQQLATQSLSIANQSTQLVMSLFR